MLGAICTVVPVVSIQTALIMSIYKPVKAVIFVQSTVLVHMLAVQRPKHYAPSPTEIEKY